MKRIFILISIVVMTSSCSQNSHTYFIDNELEEAVIIEGYNNEIGISNEIIIEPLERIKIFDISSGDSIESGPGNVLSQTFFSDEFTFLDSLSITFSNNKSIGFSLEDNNPGVPNPLLEDTWVRREIGNDEFEFVFRITQEYQEASQ